MELDCNKFNIGEAVVKRYLEEDCGETVIDVSKNKDYWVQDVDFLVVKGNKSNKIEVKYDRCMYYTGNFFIELMSNIEQHRPGWIDYTKADYLFYFDPISYLCYVMKLADLRNWIQEHDYQIKYCRKDGYKTSSGAIVPIDEYKKDYEMKVIDLNKYKQQ